jgi:hypothetical protein
MLNLFHLLSFLIAEARATADGSAVKEVECEHCGLEYVYQLRRTARGRAQSFLFRDAEAAETDARANLNRVLKEDCDPVPCPGCGWYQRPMVQLLKRRRHRNLLRAGFVLLPLSIVLAAVAVLISPVAGEPPLPQSAMARVLLGLAALAFVLGLSLPVAKYISGWRYDPNAVDEDLRREIGQARACSKADYDPNKALPPRS